MSCWPIDNNATVTRLDTAKAVSIVARAPRRSGVRWPADRSDDWCAVREHRRQRRKAHAHSRCQAVDDGSPAGKPGGRRQRLCESRRLRASRQRGSAGRPDGRDRGRLHLRQVQREWRPEARPEDRHDRVRPVREGSQPVPDRRNAVDQGRGEQAGHQAPHHQRRVRPQQGDLGHQGDGRSGRPGADHLAAQLRGPRSRPRLRPWKERADHDDRPLPHHQGRVQGLHRLGRLRLRRAGQAGLRRDDPRDRRLVQPRRSCSARPASTSRTIATTASRTRWPRRPPRSKVVAEAGRRLRAGEGPDGDRAAHPGPSRDQLHLRPQRRDGAGRRRGAARMRASSRATSRS